MKSDHWNYIFFVLCVIMWCVYLLIESYIFAWFTGSTMRLLFVGLSLTILSLTKAASISVSPPD